MYLIVGLGNPESDYSQTRHNMGFNVINKLADKYGIEVNKSKFNALYGKGKIKDEQVVLIKPQTYMNLSGEAVQEFVNFYKVDMENVLVIYDDIDTEPGKIRIRKTGGAGTHNGMKSVVNCLGSQEFPRIRVGIGMPKFKDDLINYVLGHIPDEEKEILDGATSLAAKAIESIVENGIDIAMNKYN